MKRKFSVILLLIICIFAFTSCGNESATSSTDESQSTDTTDTSDTVPVEDYNGEVTSEIFDAQISIKNFECQMSDTKGYVGKVQKNNKRYHKYGNWIEKYYDGTSLYEDTKNGWVKTEMDEYQSDFFIKPFELFSKLKGTFSDFTYNSDSKEYVKENFVIPVNEDNISLDKVCFKFKDNEILSCTIYSDDIISDLYQFEFTNFNNVEVKVPHGHEFTETTDMTDVGIKPIRRNLRCDTCGKIVDSLFYFGYYPQTDVTELMGEELSAYVSAEKPTSEDSQGFTSYKYYMNSSNKTDFIWYKDIDVDSDGQNDYRCVYFDQYAAQNTTSGPSDVSYSYQYENGYLTGNYYFFKYEPIKWTLMEETDGQIIMSSDLILDKMEFYDNTNNRTIKNSYNRSITVYPKDYEYSNVKSFLDNNFYNDAFNESQKELVNTIDLLSTDDIFNDDYGYRRNYNSDRQKTASDYAECLGVKVWHSFRYLDYGTYMLSTPFVKGGHTDMIYRVGFDGQIVTTSVVAYYGIVPSISVKVQN
ncbi:MAG: hypothetical protein ACI3XX_02600 [Eubacteriales bacterium]